jgi:hypothetical protein
MNNFRPQVPLIGQNGSREQQAKIEILQAMNSLSLSIYKKMSGVYLGALGHAHVDVEKLKTMAKNSRVAAEAYFEGLGIISK